MINLHDRKLLDQARIEPATSYQSDARLVINEPILVNENVFISLYLYFSDDSQESADAAKDRAKEG